MSNVQTYVVISLMALLPALIAQAKGRPFLLWWMYGVLLFPIALIHAAIIKSDRAETEHRLMAEQLKTNLRA